MTRPYLVLAALGVSTAFACTSENPNTPGTGGTSATSAGSSSTPGTSGSHANAGGAPATAGTGGSGNVPTTAGTTGTAGTAQGTAGTTQGTAGTTGAAGTTGTAGTTGAGGVGGAGGTTGAGGSGGSGNPGSYPPPPRDIMVTSTDKVEIAFGGNQITPAASGTHTALFDPKAAAGIQKKLVLPLGGVNSGPMKMGWAVQRGFHVLALPFWNNYPNDTYHREYLESWSGEDLSAQITQSPANSVMSRVKGSLAYLKNADPGSDWGYYLDANGEVRWNDVIVFGYSFGGQMGVAATKYVALDRVIITASPNIPINSPWLTEMPSVTPVERCYQFVGFKEGEHKTHIDETTKLGWLGEPFDVENGITKPPPYPSNRLIVEDGHSDFCGRPFNDGMKDWDHICEWLFNVQ
jgi:hypothetical protein